MKGRKTMAIPNQGRTRDDCAKCDRKLNGGWIFAWRRWWYEWRGEAAWITIPEVKAMYKRGFRAGYRAGLRNRL